MVSIVSFCNLQYSMMFIEQIRVTFRVKQTMKQSMLWGGATLWLTGHFHAFSFGLWVAFVLQPFQFLLYVVSPSLVARWWRPKCQTWTLKPVVLLTNGWRHSDSLGPLLMKKYMVFGLGKSNKPVSSLESGKRDLIVTFCTFVYNEKMPLNETGPISFQEMWVDPKAYRCIDSLPLKEGASSSWNTLKSRGYIADLNGSELALS